MREDKLEVLPGERAEEPGVVGANILRLAHYDRITGLPNRFLFREKIAQMLARGASQAGLVAILCIKLDRLDRLRRHADRENADFLLREAAERLRACLAGQGMAARTGSDQFAACIYVSDADAAYRLAEHMGQELAAPFAAGDAPCHLRPSIGICVEAAGSADGDALLTGAESAMLDAQARDGDQRLFAHRGAKPSGDLVVLRAGLRRALQQGELFLQYQPGIDPDSGSIAAVEALLRWNHPQLGIVPPEHLVALANETGEIVEIRRWVLQEVCTQARIWHAMGFGGVAVALNASAMRFNYPGLAGAVAEALDRSGLDPQCLELELSESVMLPQTHPAAGMPDELRAMGVRIALADFGGGYSCLGRLTQFPFDVLKLDRTSVSDLMRDPVDAAIVRAIIALGRILDFASVAEGVETREQFDFLRAERCSRVQGAYVSPALDPEVLLQLLKQRRGALQECMSGQDG